MCGTRANRPYYLATEWIIMRRIDLHNCRLAIVLILWNYNFSYFRMEILVGTQQQPRTKTKSESLTCQRWAQNYRSCSTEIATAFDCDRVMLINLSIIVVFSFYRCLSSASQSLIFVCFVVIIRYLLRRPYQFFHLETRSLAYQHHFYHWYREISHPSSQPNGPDA